jgi:hypothetical protein
MWPMGLLYIFNFFSRTAGPILPRLGTNHPWRERTQVFLKERDSPSPRGDNIERVKIRRHFLKIFFSRISRPNSIKLGTNYHWAKGIQVCSNKGPGPFQRGDNHKNVKMGWGHLKIFFSRTTDNIERVKIHRKFLKIFSTRISRPKSIKIGTNYSLMKRIQVCSNKGPDRLQRGIITEM